jgi:hypothetical protein
LRHYTSRRFWHCFDALPADIQELARKNYALLRRDQRHPSLQFKPVSHGRYRSVRVGLHFRALGLPLEDGVLWFWIGSHAEYDEHLA